MGAPQLQYAIPAGGGVPVGVAGAGTVNRLTKWTAATTIGDSGISDDGATVSFVARNLSSSAAQTWTLANSATALNIQSGLLNLDTANSRVGIGVTDPGVLLEVYGNGAAYPGIIRASGNGVGGTSAFQAAKFSTDADGSIFQFIKHRGTRAAPTTVATGDILGSSQYVAYGGTSFRTLSQIVAGVTAYTSDSNISSYLSFATSTAGSAAGTEKMRIDSSGNVGIGTASPTDRMVIGAPAGTAAFGITIGETFGAGSGRARLALADSNRGIGLTAANDILTHTYSGQNILFGHGTTAAVTERMRIDGTGNVGIGTASPVGLLNVRAALNATNLNLTSTTEGVNSYVELRLSSGDATGIYPNRAALIRGYTTAVGTDQNELAFFTAGSGAPAEAMRITYDKKVGIGTASPAALLHVNGNQIGGAGASVTPYAQALFGPSSAYTMWWKTNATAGGGLIGSAGPSIYFYVASGTPNAPTLLQVANFDSTGNFILGAASGVSIQAAGTNQGLKLPATPGNADSQTLDCYAEGTWTPTLAGFVTNTPGTIAASYTRVGRMVTLNVYLYAGGSSFGSTLGTTTVTVPSGMTPNFNGVGHGGLSRTTSSVAQVIAYYDGKVYLGTSTSAATEMWASVTYFV